MVDANSVEQLLQLGHETRGFELKAAGDLADKAYVAKVARAVMAMGNLRDGGWVCLGIDEKTQADMLPGLSAEQQLAWTNFDDVNDKLARYADPPVALHPHALTLSNGSRVVILAVEEFHDAPHVCKADYSGELQAGHTYVRPRGKPQSVVVPTASDMRDLLDLAVAKGVRNFVRTAASAGIRWSTAPSPEEIDAAAFQREYDAAWANESEVMRSILNAGRFDVALRPGPYDEERVSPAQLERLISGSAVRMRGWPVPFIGNAPVVRDDGWIGQDEAPSSVPHLEAWRVLTSGQFLQRRVIATDLSTSNELAAWAQNAIGAVAVWDILLYTVELAELGARIATATEAATLTASVALDGIAGRQLISGTYSRDFPGSHVISANRLAVERTFSTAELVADPRQAGIQPSQKLLAKFGIEFSEEVLHDWQDEVFSQAR